MSAPSGKDGVHRDSARAQVATPQRATVTNEAALARNPLLRLQTGAGNQAVRDLLGGGQPLPTALRSEMEQRFGDDFSQVRIHDHTEAHAAASGLKAKAFTYGKDIVFGRDRYAPDAADGRRLLAHELAHVIQQRRGGAVPTFEPHATEERSADVAANAVASGATSVSVHGGTAIGVSRASAAERDDETNHQLPSRASMAVIIQQSKQASELTSQPAPIMESGFKGGLRGRAPNAEEPQVFEMADRRRSAFSQKEIFEDIAEAQPIASGGVAIEPALDELPDPRSTREDRGDTLSREERARLYRILTREQRAQLRALIARGLRSPGESIIPTRVKRALRRAARRASLAENEVAVASGWETQRTAATAEDLSPGERLAAFDPEEIRASKLAAADAAERGEIERGEAADIRARLEHSHEPNITSDPLIADKVESGPLREKKTHRGMWHKNEFFKPLETPLPRDPHYDENWGSQLRGDRKPPATGSDAQILREYRRRAKTDPLTAAVLPKLEEAMAQDAAPGKPVKSDPQHFEHNEARTSPRNQQPLNAEQRARAREALAEMGVPPEKVLFHDELPDSFFGGLKREEVGTSYWPNKDVVVVAADLMPLAPSRRPASLANQANAAVGPLGVLAHEVVGHREAKLGGQTRRDRWHEESQASSRAARHGPGLSDAERWLLLKDAAARVPAEQRGEKIYIDLGRYGPDGKKILAPSAAVASRPEPGERAHDPAPTVIVDPTLTSEPVAKPTATPDPFTHPGQPAVSPEVEPHQSKALRELPQRGEVGAESSGRGATKPAKAALNAGMHAANQAAALLRTHDAYKSALLEGKSAAEAAFVASRTYLENTNPVLGAMATAEQRMQKDARGEQYYGDDGMDAWLGTLGESGVGLAFQGAAWDQAINAAANVAGAVDDRLQRGRGPNDPTNGKANFRTVADLAADMTPSRLAAQTAGGGLRGWYDIGRAATGDIKGVDKFSEDAVRGKLGTVFQPAGMAFDFLGNLGGDSPSVALEKTVRKTKGTTLTKIGEASGDAMYELGQSREAKSGKHGMAVQGISNVLGVGSDLILGRSLDTALENASEASKGSLAYNVGSAIGDAAFTIFETGKELVTEDLPAEKKRIQTKIDERKKKLSAWWKSL